MLTNIWQVGDPMHSLITFVKQDLNKNMTTFFPGVHQEVRTVIEERLGHSQGPTDNSFLDYVRSVLTVSRLEIIKCILAESELHVEDL